MKNVVIFSDSMVKGLKMKQFNSHIHGGKVYLKAFPGAKADQLNQLKIAKPNQVRYDERSSKIWNNLPAHVKSAPNLLSFKRLIKSWYRISCKCTLCKKL